MSTLTNTKKDIGFLFGKLNNHTICNNAISLVKQFSSDFPYNQYIIFNSYNERTDTNSIPILHINQSKFFYGNMFLFDFMSIILTENFPNIHRRFLYLENAPWSTNPQSGFSDLKKIFDSPNLEIIAGNNFVNDICEICWKKPLCIAENLNYEIIKNII